MGSVVTLFLNGWASRFRTRPDFETAHFAGSKLCPPRSSPIAAEPARPQVKTHVRWDEKPCTSDFKEVMIDHSLTLSPKIWYNRSRNFFTWFF